MIVQKAIIKTLWSEAIVWAHRLLLKTERPDGRSAVSGKWDSAWGSTEGCRLGEGGVPLCMESWIHKVWMVGEILFQRRPYAPFQGEGSKTFSYVCLRFSLPSQSPPVLWPSYQHILRWKYVLNHSVLSTVCLSFLFSVSMADSDLVFWPAHGVAATTQLLTER